MKIELIKPLVFTERNSKAGNKYRAADAQGIVHGDNGSAEVFAFLMMAPRGEQGTDLPAGHYTPVTEFRVSLADRRPSFEIVGFKPIKG